jgi:hypothetical protein
MNPSFFSKPAVFAPIADADAAGPGVAPGFAGVLAHPTAALEMSAKENAEALFIVIAKEDGRL